jgi:hypothetical protein
VRSLGCPVNSLNRELHPVLPLRIDHEDLAIHVQQRVEAVVTEALAHF